MCVCVFVCLCVCVFFCLAIYSYSLTTQYEGLIFISCFFSLKIYHFIQEKREPSFSHYQLTHSHLTYKDLHASATPARTLAFLVLHDVLEESPTYQMTENIDPFCTSRTDG